MDVWDHRNRLLTVRERATDGGDLTKVVDYVYDSHNRWIGRVADADGAGPAPADSSRFTYDGNQIVLQSDGSGALTRRNLWGPAVDQILAEEEVESPSAVGNVLWPLTDQIGSARDVAQFNLVTATTQIVAHRVFDSFGKLVSESSPGSGDILIGFTGRPFDKATGLQNNLHRWYYPSSIEWLNEDPFDLSAGDSRVRRYVRNNPVILIDPFGMEPVWTPQGVARELVNSGHGWVLVYLKNRKVASASWIEDKVAIYERLPNGEKGKLLRIEYHSIAGANIGGGTTIWVRNTDSDAEAASTIYHEVLHDYYDLDRKEEEVRVRIDEENRRIQVKLPKYWPRKQVNGVEVPDEAKIRNDVFGSPVYGGGAPSTIPETIDTTIANPYYFNGNQFTLPPQPRPTIIKPPTIFGPYYGDYRDNMA